jgi:hypothetical protein
LLPPEFDEDEPMPPEDCPREELEEEGMPGMDEPELERPLDELPPALPELPRELPELPPELPELPPELPEEGEELGEGMLEEEDCCSAQPPMRKALTAPTAVNRPAMRISRSREQVCMLTPSIVDGAR